MSALDAGARCLIVTSRDILASGALIVDIEFSLKLELQS